MLLDAVNRFAREPLLPAENGVADPDEIPEYLVRAMKALGLVGLFGLFGLSVVAEDPR